MRCQTRRMVTGRQNLALAWAGIRALVASTPLHRAGSSRSAQRERGSSVVEYGLLVACVAVAFIIALKLLDVLPAIFEAGACQEDRGYSCTPVP